MADETLPNVEPSWVTTGCTTTMSRRVAEREAERRKYSPASCKSVKKIGVNFALLRRAHVGSANYG